MKKLIVAEKPSVAKDIAKALGPVHGRFKEFEDHWENDKFLITSAIGHLVEICVNEDQDPKRSRWKLASLPVIPPKFDIRPIDRTKKRLFAVSKLMQRPDVSGYINACDAGREGELIFRLIEQYAGLKKPLNRPVERLWLQSMTPQAILAGMDNLRTEAQMAGLRDAAYCRSEADWIVGINGTRALTAFNSMNGGFHLTTMGRVQTPTLSILVGREDKIIKHIPKDYDELLGEFVVQGGGTYKGKWFNPKWVKSADPEDKADRLWDLERGQVIKEEIRGATATIESEEQKTTTQTAPMLFDLTSLQREANSKFGMSAKNTLSIAQSLYEKHKVLTYPRTDARCLPEDYVPVALTTLGEFRNTNYDNLGVFCEEATKLRNSWPFKKIFNNEKISDHFAIIPTGQMPRGLDEYEQRIFNLVLKRFIAVFLPTAEFSVVTRITAVKEHRFKSEGKVLKKPGWMAVFGKDASDDETPLLLEVKPSDKLLVHDLEITRLKTKPPARFNEGTLLGAMETAGKLVEDEESKEAMKDKGLGTPATRAAIIEGLLSEEYVRRSGKELVPTHKAFQLKTLLKGLGVEDFTSASLTGGWEAKLASIEKGNYSRDAFMGEIATLITTLVEKARQSSPTTLPGDGAILQAHCPSCNGETLVGEYRAFRCQGSCGFTVPRVMMGRSLLDHEIVTLLTTKRVGPLDGFRSRMGREFSTSLTLSYDEKTSGWVVAPEFQARDPLPEKVDLTDKESLGTCPCCKGEVYSFNGFYGCINSMGTSSKEATCKFRVGHIILQQEIGLPDVRQLCTTGKTDLLTKFISARNNRAFSAHLTWDNKQKRTTFEFEPRKEKTKK